METHRKKYLIIGVIVAAIIISAVFGYSYSIATQPKVPSSVVPIVNRIESSSFGQITEFKLPTPDRWPNAPYVDKDGSIWFGEWGLPGIAHFLPWNMTLIEYPIPLSNKSTAQPGFNFKVSIWSVVRAGKYIWATLMEYNQIVALDPATSKYIFFTLPEGYESPYTLAVSPQGSVWFTMISSNPYLGEILPNMSLIIRQVETKNFQIPSSILFVNKTEAYFTGISLSTYKSYLYRFNPSENSRVIVPEIVKDVNLTAANAMSFSEGTLWITEHGPTDIVSYNLSDSKLRVYPTSLNTLTNTALPYFIVSSAKNVYFNEHYGNKIAVLTNGVHLTEYSVSNPPAENISAIDNVLTLALGKDAVWFTSVTSNYIGFLNLNSKPNFDISLQGTRDITLTPSSNLTLKFVVSGKWSKPLNISFSDTENFTGSPRLISFKPSINQIQAGSGNFTFNVTIGASNDIKPGLYTAAVTVDDGLVYQSEYIFITIP